MRKLKKSVFFIPLTVTLLICFVLLGFGSAFGSDEDVDRDAYYYETSLLLGGWYFYFTIISTWYNYFYLTTISDSVNSLGANYVYGIDKYGNAIIACYYPDYGYWALLVPGTIIHQFYVFYTDGDWILPNSCYYQINASTDSWSWCFTLNGYKFSNYNYLKNLSPIIKSDALANEKKQKEEAVRLSEGQEKFMADDSILETYQQLQQVIDSQK